ncbi:heme o synthase [Natronomonas marina]|jgi:protoheme IX farnesyltransferase|uniref:heme o synthase n=1 Tax=Natronomonas marina TaxID=2961939 RepID=UPI0020C94CB7|nr:heme o synthase [Natronomonas marina]
MDRQPSATALLAAATVGVYVLVVVGATAALADAAAACSGWPACGGDVSSPAVAVVLAHRLAAAIVGLLVAVTAVFAWSDLGGRSRAALGTAVVLYPVQAGFGALVASGGGVAGLHLAVAMAIFAALVLALAWHLEAETGTDDAPARTPDPDPALDEPVPEPAPLSDLDGLRRVRATAWAYFQLMKPRLMWLLCLVAGAGMALAGTPTVRTVLATLGGGILAIGASGTFNHVLERDIDRRMERTADRPVATHVVPVRNAFAFGGLLTVAALGAFLSVNLLVAALGLAAIAFYSVVYTLMLKPNTVQNTVIGGAAGALPALIGYAAVAGTLGVTGVVLAGVIFLWTPAHFYNLALAYKDDYERGGFPMMPVVRGETETRKHILLYLGATLLAASALSALSGLGWLYAAVTVTLGGVFLWAVVRLHRERTESAAFRAFHASNAYLGLLLVAVVVDALAV